MAITYTWVVNKLITTTIANTNNVVIEVNWTKIGTDENGNKGQISLNTPLVVNSGYVSSNSFVSYSNLTPDIVLSWVQSSLGNNKEEHINILIQDSINKSITKKITPPLPWINTSNT